MNEGAWINAKTGVSAWIDEHASWIKRPQNAQGIGLPGSVQQAIKDLRSDFNGEGRAEILAKVMNAGFIRMRGHGSYWTFEFTMPTTDALWACLAFLDREAGPMTQCRFNNLRTGEAIEMPFQEFKATMSDDPERVLRVAHILTKDEHPRQEVFTMKHEGSGYPRLMQIMKGQVPSIHTFGIMSVNNPQGKPASASVNKANDAKFKEELSHSGYGYVQHGGKYGDFERAFFIMNISLPSLMRFGEVYDQESVIFGQIDREHHKVIFQLIGDQGVISSREVVLALNGDPEFYSEYKGRKFIIPFFDDSYAPGDSNLNVKVPFEFSDADLEANAENLPHLATIYANADYIRDTALGTGGHTGYMAYAKRMQIFSALKNLKM